MLRISSGKGNGAVPPRLTPALISYSQPCNAALMIVLGTLTKIYGVVGLAFFLFSKRKLYFLWGILFWAFVLFVVPMFYTSPQYVFDSYKEWISILVVKNDVNELSFYQNISLLGMVRKITHAVEYSDMWLIIPGIVLFLLPYFRIGQYENRNFRLSFLASVLLFMVLFSTGTEECGYVGALIGVGIWYVSTPTYKKSFVLNTCLLLFCFALTAASSSSILFSKHFRTEYITSFALKALPCAIIWFKIIWEQLTQDYTSRTPTPFLHKKDDERIDVILPCYNPHEGWEQQLIEKHKELEGMLNGYNIRFIVVNDGSKRGFTEEAVLRLTNNLPNTIIVDNKINQGKGAAVRDGIAHSDSELALYTDYDFPYKIESVCQVIKYLEEHNVVFHYNTKVVNVEFEINGEKKQAVRIVVDHKGDIENIDLTENDLVFITNGGCVENSSIGSQNKPAKFNPEIKPGGGWDMWMKIAAQSPDFGHPEKFCYDPEQTNWMSATVTTLDQKIVPYIQNICKRDPFSGRVVTGGIVTVKDSNWLLSWTFNRQPQFRSQPKGQLVGWIYGLFSNVPGNFVKKPMRDCTGKEICMEWLYHLGVPTEQIEELAENSANTVPCMMPYITAFFMPRAEGDRPLVVPKGSVNFAFLGQFAETKRDTIFTTEYSMRTGMEAVYTLLDIDRGVPEVWGSVYDIRDLLKATVQLRDGKKITDMDLGLMERIALKEILKKVRNTDIEKLLKEYNVI